MTVAPVERVKLETSAVTTVPYGTVSAIVLALSLITPVTAGDRPAKEKAVIALPLLARVITTKYRRVVVRS